MPRVPMKVQIDKLNAELYQLRLRINEHDKQLATIEKQELVRTSQSFRNMTLWIHDLENYATEVVEAEIRWREGIGTLPDMQFAIANLATTLRGKIEI